MVSSRTLLNEFRRILGASDYHNKLWAEIDARGSIILKARDSWGWQYSSTKSKLRDKAVDCGYTLHIVDDATLVARPSA